jgi:putative peptide zinc metalloprotease protein
MVTLRDSLLSSSARKLPIRMRPDLVARRQHYLGRSYWIVKDPLGLNYYRFQEEEFAILQMLDGETNLDDIKDRFEEEFPPQKITLEELQQFLGTLHRSGLVVADLPGQGRQLAKRRAERKRKEFLAAISNILCIRCKGFDPERLLNWLYPKVRWFYSPWTVACCLMLAISALALVVAQFDIFRSRLPDFHQFFSVHNIFLLTVVLGCTKIMHEFGHGLACKHFGGECHEMGIMILVLTPCLYCNVSDSWLLPNKWRRAYIGAAGIYVELMLASICTFLWWYSTPGLLNNLCLNVMFICSVTTVIFNANPLLRYDGYYILSDVMEIPNLRQKATTITGRKLSEWCLGMEPSEDPFLPQRNQMFFVLYSIAAIVYRWIIAFSICWFLYRLFLSWHLEFVGKLVVVASLYGLFAVPLYQAGKFFYVPGRIEQVKKPHFYTSLGILTALLLAFFFLPLPYSVLCPFRLQPRDASPVWVHVPGKLVSVSVKPGQRVAEGQLLARLESSDVELAVAKLEGTVADYQTQIANAMQQSIRDFHVAGQLPQLHEALAAAEDELKEKRADAKRLRLVAPVAGTVFGPPVTTRHDDPDEKLGTWGGTPLDAENLGAFLEPVLFCQVGDPTKLEAVLVVDQADRNLIRAGEDGSKVELKLEGYPALTLHGKVAEISESELRICPPALSTKHNGNVPTKTDPHTGVEKPMSTCYEARVPFDAPDGSFRLNLCGEARVHTAPLSLGSRLWRLINHTFNFKLGSS